VTGGAGPTQGPLIQARERQRCGAELTFGSDDSSADLAARLEQTSGRCTSLTGLTEARCQRPSTLTHPRWLGCIEGTLKGLDAAEQSRTEEYLDRRIVENINEINNLGTFGYLRTKGSWVRILPAAPPFQ
jgi:hypothetical protein